MPGKNKLCLWVLFTDLQQRSDLVRNLGVQVIKSPIMMIPMAVTRVLHFRREEKLQFMQHPSLCSRSRKNGTCHDVNGCIVGGINCLEKIRVILHHARISYFGHDSVDISQLISFKKSIITWDEHVDQVRFC